MWSASAIASFWSCVTNTVVVFSRSCSLRSSTHISSRNSASSVPSGSSIRKALGWRTMARPSATRCRSPPDSPPTRESSRCSMRRMAADLPHPPVDLGARHAFVAQRELQVAAHAHVRIEREQLEHHRDVALARPQVGHVLAVQRDRAAGRVFQAGDHAQRGRLAAARRAQQHDELAVFEHQRGAAHRGEVGEALVQVLDADLSHVSAPAAFLRWSSRSRPASSTMNE